MLLRFSIQMHPLYTFSIRWYSSITCCGKIPIGIFIYYNLSIGAHRLKTIMSRHIYFAFIVLNILFHNIFDMVMSAVLVVNSPGYMKRLPPAVILKRFGSSFYGQ